MQYKIICLIFEDVFYVVLNEIFYFFLYKNYKLYVVIMKYFSFFQYKNFKIILNKLKNSM